MTLNLKLAMTMGLYWLIKSSLSFFGMRTMEFKLKFRRSQLDVKNLITTLTTSYLMISQNLWRKRPSNPSSPGALLGLREKITWCIYSTDGRLVIIKLMFVIIRLGITSIIRSVSFTHIQSSAEKVSEVSYFMVGNVPLICQKSIPNPHGRNAFGGLVDIDKFVEVRGIFISFKVPFNPAFLFPNFLFISKGLL